MLAGSFPRKLSPFQLRDGRTGLGTNPPPQFGHTSPSTVSTHVAQKVHSYEQMRASLESGRRPRSIYRTAGRPCPACGTPIRSRGQGDANRVAYWCDHCQA